MKIFRFLVTCVLFFKLMTFAHAAAESQPAESQPKKVTKSSLEAFSSEKELETFLEDWLKAAKENQKKSRRSDFIGFMDGPEGNFDAALSPPSSSFTTENKKDAEESVTNVQHAGVDEGGIVKVHKNHLVVLRRGRLFTVDIDQNSLKPISQIDAFGPGIDPSGTWYDEMLIDQDTIVVIGFSYARGGTEIGLFDIDASGKLSYRSSYHLRSNDYYSSRNYASRLIGHRLIFYTPLYLYGNKTADLFKSFPALRKWHSGASADEFKRIVSATKIYAPLIESFPLALHTVTSCDLSKPELSCEATAVMGPAGRSFYVSPSAVYVWMTPWYFHPNPKDTKTKEPFPQSLVYRLPLNGDEPSALRVHGSPIDQFSFLEDSDKHLNVLVRANGNGDGMWQAEVTQGDLAFLRVSLADFSKKAEEVPLSKYKSVPKIEGYVLQNRFVGDYLLYSSGTGWGYGSNTRKKDPLHLIRYRERNSANLSLSMNHSVDRIEALGQNTVVVGNDGQDLYFTPIQLSASPKIMEPYKRTGASQGELRSHGFFYKPENDSAGLLGLPIREPNRPGAAHLVEGSASVLFLKNEHLRFSELGALHSANNRQTNDNCKASCIDWYGNARPLFLRGRIFALLGYEIVEGLIQDGRIQEKQRIQFSPKR